MTDRPDFQLTQPKPPEPKRDPFVIDGPTCLSFSGGSTSGYMLWRTLQANPRSVLDQYLRVAFANTGCEHEKTLEFVRECELRWGFPIEWVEYRDSDAGYEVVNFDNASRNGEPFEAIIRKRNYLPNPVTRFCTSELKIRAMHKHLKSLGWHEANDGWDQFIGIRADEPRRVGKIRARGHSTETSKETMLMPLADAGIGYQDVDDFWGGAAVQAGATAHQRAHAGWQLRFLLPEASGTDPVADAYRAQVRDFLHQGRAHRRGIKAERRRVPHGPPKLRTDGGVLRQPGRPIRCTRGSAAVLLRGLT